MSKELCSASSNLFYHAQELRIKFRAIHNARLDMERYPNTPKYDLIVSELLPRLEADIKEEMERIFFWTKELERSEYNGNDNYKEWYS